MTRTIHLAVVTLALAISSPAQTISYTFEGTVETSMNPTGIWSGVQIGDPFRVTYRVRSDAPGTGGPPEVSYFDAVSKADLSFGGVKSSAPLVSSEVRVRDNVFGFLCEDELILTAEAQSDYFSVRLSLLTDDQGTGNCPTGLSSTDLPLTLSAADFPFNSVRLTTVAFSNFVDGSVTSVTIAVSSFNDLCNGDGGDQMGCTDCPCSNDAPQGTVGGCLNSTGTSARLLASGSASLLAADLCFELSGGKPDSFAVLTSGSAIAPTNMANPCFTQNPTSGITSIALDGLRCRVGRVFRHGSRGIDAAGFVGPQGPPPSGSWGYCSANFPNAAFSAGERRYFQAFYREEPGVICGTELNTSQAIEVLLTP